MTDSTSTPSPAQSPAESANAQTIVSMAIVSALSIIALAAIAAALVDKSIAAVAFGAVGVVVGSLATALNAPTGIANVIATAKKPTAVDQAPGQ